MSNMASAAIAAVKSQEGLKRQLLGDRRLDDAVCVVESQEGLKPLGSTSAPRRTPLPPR